MSTAEKERDAVVPNQRGSCSSHFSCTGGSVPASGIRSHSSRILGSALLGLLVHADNHFVVRGPEPDDGTAQSLVRHWSVINIGQRTPEHLRLWQISTHEFRENLQWPVVVGSGDHSPAVVQLLAELAARGVEIRRVG